MKKPACRLAASIILLLLCGVLSAAAQGAASQKYEFAIIKWDGPDRIQYILPDKFEVARLGKRFPRPDGAQEEEYYLAMATNELAKQGWEAVAFDSRRILLRRSIIK